MYLLITAVIVDESEDFMNPNKGQTICDVIVHDLDLLFLMCLFFTCLELLIQSGGKHLKKGVFNPFLPHPSPN